MRLQSNTPAPAFETTDVFDAPFSLETTKGSKVLLAFMRFAGCPVCNLRVHELLKNAERFKKQNMKVVLVYESSKEIMREYLMDEEYPFTFIADPQNKLYDLYAVETSLGKLLSSLFKELITKVKAGQKLFKRKVADDGKVTRMHAEFIIDANGKISKAHYAEFLGDDLPVSDILK